MQNEETKAINGRNLSILLSEFKILQVLQFRILHSAFCNCYSEFPPTGICRESRSIAVATRRNCPASSSASP
jgi:hypothetical protein